MGCDIHAHIELKINGKWEHYSNPLIRRRYALFEKIAGVRGEESAAIVPPRGVPTDMSLVTQICWNFEKEGRHTPTWLNKEEFLRLLDWANKKENLRQEWDGQFEHEEIGYLTGNSFHLYKGSNPPEVEDVRFICWFDN